MTPSLLAGPVIIMLAVIAWAVRIWIKATIERGTQAAFDRGLEQLRSDLRVREASLASLQNAVLQDRGGQAAVLDKRRIEALEAVWAETVRLRPAMMSVTNMRLLRYDVLEQRAPKEPKLREMLSLLQGDGKMSLFQNTTIDVSQPFVSDAVWANFIAYKAVLVSAVVSLEILASGIEDASKFFTKGPLVEMVKVALPGSAKYLDRVGEVGVYHLTDQLLDALLRSIRLALQGRDSDEAAVERARNIMELARKAEASRASAANELAAGTA